MINKLYGARVGITLVLFGFAGSYVLNKNNDAFNESPIWMQGVILFAVMAISILIIRIGSSKNSDRLSESSIEDAIDSIEKHGMKAHVYFAGISNRNDKELSNALDTLEAAGYIVTDDSGMLVGKVATKRLSVNEQALQRRAEFKIVE
jgi:hypothetical protein